MGVLGRDVRREEGVAVRSRVDEDRVAFDRCGRDPLVLDPRPHHHLRVGERVPAVGRVHRAHRLGDVAADLGELQRSVRREGRLHVDDDVEQVVVDVHQPAASTACARVSATTSATGSPTKRTTPSASGPCPISSWTSANDGTHSRPSVSAVCTARTPGDRSALEVSRWVIVAWASGLGRRRRGRAGDPQVVDVGAASVDEQLGVLDPANAVAEDRSHHEPEEISVSSALACGPREPTKGCLP